MSLDKKAAVIHNKLQEAVNSEEFDEDHAKDLVYDVTIGNVPIEELAQKSVDLEFEHVDGPGTLYQLEETIEHVLTEWVEDAIPEELAEYREYIHGKYWDDVKDKAEQKFKQQKED